jgi:hypothetical protein
MHAAGVHFLKTRSVTATKTLERQSLTSRLTRRRIIQQTGRHLLTRQTFGASMSVVFLHGQ